jgi:hypothetical protein
VRINSALVASHCLWLSSTACLRTSGSSSWGKRSALGIAAPSAAPARRVFHGRAPWRFRGARNRSGRRGGAGRGVGSEPVLADQNDQNFARHKRAFDRLDEIDARLDPWTSMNTRSAPKCAASRS